MQYVEYANILFCIKNLNKKYDNEIMLNKFSRKISHILQIHVYDVCNYILTLDSCLHQFYF